MRFVGTAVVAGTIGVFSLLIEGEWIQGGTGKSVAIESASPDKSRKVPFRYQHFRDVEGIAVENVDGERIGTIKDFIVDSKSGQVSYVIVKTGGSLLTRRRLILVPASAIAITTTKVGVAAIDITKQRWTRAPEFSRKELPALTRADKARQIAAFYGRAEPVARGPQSAERQTTQLTSSGREANAATASRRIGPYRLASDLLGKPLVSREGTELGEISDLMMNVDGEQSMLAIISTDAISRNQERFAVPLRLINRTSNEKLVVNAKRLDFKNAAEFQPENLPTLAKGEAREIFRYER